VISVDWPDHLCLLLSRSLNCGLHDCARDGSPDNPEPRVSLTQYESNLRSIVRKVRGAKPHTKIILCTSTCVNLETQVAVNYGIYRSNEDVEEYNSVMREVAASEGVHLHDLHSVAVARADELGEDGVHWTEGGAWGLGQAVAEHLWTHNCDWGAASIATPI
jgi:lysophospholipase L1-like esterase